MPQDQRRQDAPRRTAVPGSARKFRSAIASSGVGSGDRRAARARPRDAGTGIGCFRTVKVRRSAIAGMRHKKMNTEASRNGDHPLSTASERMAACRIRAARRSVGRAWR